MSILSIEPGQIRVGTILEVVNEDDFKAWVIDCQSKYPSWLQSFDTDDRHEILLIADERTLRPAEGVTTATVVTLNLPQPNGWRVFVDAARYTVQVVAYRWREENVKHIWQDGAPVEVEA